MLRYASNIFFYAAINVCISLSEKGRSALRFAAREGHARIVDILCKNEADVNIMDECVSLVAREITDCASVGISRTFCPVRVFTPVQESTPLMLAASKGWSK